MLRSPRRALGLDEDGQALTDVDAHEAVIEYLISAMYSLGQVAERERIAAGRAELDATWKPRGRHGYDQKVAERVALFERCAVQLAKAMGRPPGWRYTGGPVDWETGRPVARRAAA